MKEIVNTFSRTQLRDLKSLEGQEFRFIGGPEVPDFLVSDSFVISGSKSALKVSGNTMEVQVNENVEEFSKLEVEVADANLVAATLKSGNMFLLNRRNAITGISVVRETLVHEGSDGEEWTLNSDVAVVIHLAKGNLILRLVSHSVEAIAVEFVMEFNVSAFEKPSSRFANDLFDGYRSKLALFSVS
jgi:hypothetical protein